MEYGRDFDFKRSFFEQFGELIKDVPRAHLISIGNENCEYVHLLLNSKNCYLSVSGKNNTDCWHCSFLDRCDSCLDSSSIEDSDNLYQCFSIKKSHDCSFSSFLENCSHCSHCFDCINCSNCIGCVWIKNKQFYIYNEPVTEEVFRSFVQNNPTIDQKKLEWLMVRHPRKNMNISETEQVIWDDVARSKNIYDSYSIQDSTDIKYSYRGYFLHDSMDVIWTADGSMLYEVLSCSNKPYRLAFTNLCYPNCSELLLCDHCSTSSNLFACIGLRNKSYCIFNKQYTREGYEELVPQIIEHMKKTGEWGEFFPSSLSPFGYNETVAQEYYPLTKDEAMKNRAFNWSDYEAPFPKVEKIIPAAKLPEDISKIPDDILNWAIECEVTGKPFRIIKQELEFYRKHNLPIPRRHPDQRHLDRMALRNPRKLFERKCDKCGVEMMTTYSNERKEIVYCEGCYNKEIL
ncbi:MAG: hypothetical protein ACD_71C00047G0001 [uncultured bacterium (gcode 4)]|uniref:Caib/baif family protein n=1 Tax=uncultured bacterium (gcode 4) TaxID=1234023 RepID=K1Z5D1_9BACT|nr:MAG: hypothetical protein ACD_71C00047G0001 [uncultured bacterium (gcode 4)]